MRTVDPALTPRHERIYETIRERILAGVYPAGFRIVIVDIAAELDLSTIPVREALRWLEADGLVTVQPNYTAQVAGAEPRSLADQLEILAVLDGYVAAAAAAHIGAAEITALRRTNDRLAAAVDAMDSFGFLLLDLEFHELIYSRCDNSIAARKVESLARRLAPARRMLLPSVPYRTSASVREHRRLIELIGSGAPAREIELAARHHKMQCTDAVRSLLGADSSTRPQPAARIAG